MDNIDDVDHADNEEHDKDDDLEEPLDLFQFIEGHCVQGGIYFIGENSNLSLLFI